MPDIRSLGLSKEITSKIEQLGVSETQELSSIFELAEKEITDYIGEGADKIKADLKGLAPVGKGEEPKEEVIYSFGVALEKIPAVKKAYPIPPVTAVQLPKEVNLINQMTGVQNQSPRETCVAFATVALMEHKYKKDLNFSEQFQYWNCKNNDGIPNLEGTWLDISVPLLGSDGCCRENTWPYNSNKIPSNEGQGPPPAGAVAEAAKNKVNAHTKLAPTSVFSIKSALAGGYPVAFSVPVFSTISANSTRVTGNILNPVANQKPVGGHAMVFVGYKDSGESGIGGGRFYLRNSWGKQWAFKSMLGGKPTPGYGTISYSYISSYGMEAFYIL